MYTYTYIKLLNVYIGLVQNHTTEWCSTVYYRSSNSATILFCSLYIYVYTWLKIHACRNEIFKTQLNKIGTTPLVLHQPYILYHGCGVWQLWCLQISCISEVVHRWVNSFTVNILKVCSDKCRCHYPCKVSKREGVRVFSKWHFNFSNDQWTTGIVYCCQRWKLFCMYMWLKLVHTIPILVEEHIRRSSNIPVFFYCSTEQFASRWASGPDKLDFNFSTGSLQSVEFGY